jgi:SAM-dependent methyltransferase
MYLVMQYLTDSLVAARDEYVPRGAALLDVGCGDMPYYPIFAELVGDYAGADLFPGTNVRYVCPSEKLSVPDESFDVALSTQMLEHVRDPHASMSEIRRVLRPGGVALVSTHGVWPYHPVPNDYWRWTHEGLAALLEDVGGFDLVEIVPHGGTAACLASLVNYYLAVWSAGKGSLIGRLSGYTVAVVNLLAILTDRSLKQIAYPAEHSLTMNYLVIARRR